MFALALFTALVIFALPMARQLAGLDYDPVLLRVVVALVFALMIAIMQIAALGLLRLVPWQGPSLKVEGGDHLRQVFE